MNGQQRSSIRKGLEVDIVLKADQRSGKLTRGIVKDILTNSSFHPRGIKVRLEDGRIGRCSTLLNRKKPELHARLFFFNFSNEILICSPFIYKKF